MMRTLQKAAARGAAAFALLAGAACGSGSAVSSSAPGDGGDTGNGSSSGAASSGVLDSGALDGAGPSDGQGASDGTGGADGSRAPDGSGGSDASGASDGTNGPDGAVSSDAPADAPITDGAAGTQDVSNAASDASAACPPPENDAGTCNSLELAGPIVTPMCLSGEPPQATGGTIANGTYVLQSNTVYGTCPGDLPTSTTWQICGSHWDLAQSTMLDDASRVPEENLNYETMLQGSSVAFTLTCIPPDENGVNVGTRGYTATSSQLTFIYADPITSGATHVAVYIRQ